MAFICQEVPDLNMAGTYTYVYPSQGSNPRPPDQTAEAVTTEPIPFAFKSKCLTSLRSAAASLIRKYSQTYIRETPFGKSKLSFIHRFLSYQGSVRIFVMMKFSLSIIHENYNIMKTKLCFCIVLYDSMLLYTRIKKITYEQISGFTGLCILHWIVLLT